jgi:hypothetical protein
VKSLKLQNANNRGTLRVVQLLILLLKMKQVKVQIANNDVKFRAE